MVQAFFLSILFVTSLFIQTSIFASLPLPLSYIPFHFLVGVIVMHRSNVYFGTAWFLFTWPFFEFLSVMEPYSWVYVVVALVGILFSNRMFTNRSVYALAGLGISLFFVFSLTKLILTIIPSFSGSYDALQINPIQSSISSGVYGMIFLVLGLYIGFIISRYAENVTHRLFLVREHN